jgi:hypothetical protein
MNRDMFAHDNSLQINQKFSAILIKILAIIMEELVVQNLLVIKAESEN